MVPLNLEHHKLSGDTFGVESGFHLMSPVTGYQPTSGQLRAAAFQSSRPGQATNVWTQPLHDLLKSQRCVSWTMAAGQNTHILVFTTIRLAFFYWFLPSSLALHRAGFCAFHLLVLFLLPSTALCLRCFHPPASKLATTTCCLASLQPPHHSGFPLLLGPWSGFL